MRKVISMAAQRPNPPATDDAECRLEFQTSGCLDAIDLTDRIERMVAEAAIDRGLAFVQSLHTTAAIVVNENEPLLWEDLRQSLEQFAPRDRRYRHDDFAVRTVNMTPNEQANGHAHCKALVLPTSVTLGISGGRLVLGRWQRVFLLELDCARPRTVLAMIHAARSSNGSRGML